MLYLGGRWFSTLRFTSIQLDHPPAPAVHRSTRRWNIPGTGNHDGNDCVQNRVRHSWQTLPRPVHPFPRVARRRPPALQRCAPDWAAPASSGGCSARRCSAPGADALGSAPGWSSSPRPCRLGPPEALGQTPVMRDMKPEAFRVKQTQY